MDPWLRDAVASAECPPCGGPGHPTGQAEVTRGIDRSQDRRRCPTGDTGEANSDHYSTLMFEAATSGRCVNLMPQQGC